MSGQPSSSSMERGASTSPLRPISFGDPVVNIERRDDGTIYLRPKQPLGDYPVRLTDRLHHWATTTPDRVFMAEREGGRGWRQITYAELLAASRHIASGLIARGLENLGAIEPPFIEVAGNTMARREVEGRVVLDADETDPLFIRRKPRIESAIAGPVGNQVHLSFRVRRRVDRIEVQSPLSG